MSADLTGRTFGNYRVVRKLGEGGMGAVYEAEHPDIGSRVAIKVLRSHLAGDPELVSRFFREARAANQVRHPNVVQVMDLGHADSGAVYAVMELLEGESLAARLRRGGPLPLGAVRRIFLECASALAAVHERGVVHRDLKPDNIYLAREGEREVAKILDFGVAKLLEGDATLSASGMIVGTPMYMSPEQCEGRRNLDARADVYSMGCVLYDMVAGEPPFRADSLNKVLLHHLNTPAPLLGARRPDVPALLEAAVARALEKDAERRFASMADFAEAVRAAIPEGLDTRSVPGSAGADTIPARSPSTLTAAAAAVPATTAPPLRRYGWVAGLAVVGVAGAIALWAVSRRAASPQEAEVVPEEKAPAPDAAIAVARASPVDAAPAVAASEAECRAALERAAALLAAEDVGAAVRPYRHLRRYSASPADAAALVDMCLKTFDATAAACLRDAAVPADVAACNDRLLERRCAAGADPDACGSVAWMRYADGAYAEAAKLARAACLAGAGSGCGLLGTERYHGRGQPADMVAARADLVRGAALGEPDADALLGWMDRYGLGAPADAGKARAHLQAACVDDTTAACVWLGEMETAGEGGPPEKPAAALERDRKACEADVPDGCLRLGDAVAGEAPAAYAKARRLYEERRDVFPYYALRLGEMAAAGKGQKASPDEAAAQYAAGCAAGEPLSCQALAEARAGDLPGFVRARKEVADAYARACQAGLARGCAGAACVKLLDPDTPSVDPDALEACRKDGLLPPAPRASGTVKLRRRLREPKGQPPPKLYDDPLDSPF